jgi:hypothetical protein
MKKGTIILFFFFFLIGILLNGCKGIEKDLVSGKTDQPQNVDEIKVVNLSIIDEEEKIDFEVNFWEGMTVFDLLKKVSETNNVKLEFEESAMGVFITGFMNKTGGTENKYWLYYVNGEMPNVAVDKKTLKNHDKVEFKFLPLEQ